MPGPLHGVRVLDLTGVVSGPFATMFLADQGADVLKIEPIGGDITRRSRATIDKGGEFSALFISSNRGRRQERGWPRGSRQAGGTGRRAGAEFPPRRHGAAGARRRRIAPAPSAPDLCLDQRRRRDRTLRKEARL